MILSIKKNRLKTTIIVGFTKTVVNFWRFLSQFLTNCHEILQALFFIDGSTTHEILYGLKFDM